MNNIKIEMDINDKNGNIANICGFKVKAINNEALKYLFKSYKPEALKTTNSNPLLESEGLNNMFKFITNDDFIESYLYDEDEDFDAKIDALFEGIKTSYSIITTNKEKYQKVFNILKVQNLKLKELSNNEDKIADKYKKLISIIENNSVKLTNNTDMTINIQESEVFSSVNFINNDIKSKKSKTNKVNTIFPFNQNANSAFLNSCLKLGNKLNVGSAFDDIELTISNFEKAITYYQNNRDIDSKLKNDKTFELYFTGTFRKPVKITTISKAQQIKNDIESSKTLNYSKINNVKLNEKNSNKDISLRLLEYIIEPFEIIVDIPLIQDEKIKRIYTLGNLINRKVHILFDKLKNSQLEYNDGMILDSDTGEIITNKKNTKLILDILGEKYNQKVGDLEAKYDHIMTSLTGTIKPYWWQKELIENASNGISQITVGPTSGGKTLGSGLALIKILNNSKNGEICVYSAPTDPLAIQIFSNMYASFPIRDKMAIICGCAVYIPENPTLYIGTPKELRDYFTNINSNLVYGNESESANTLIPKCITDTNIKKIHALIIDECHTMAENYSTSQDEKKTSAANQELLSMLDNTEPRIFIGLSATMSYESILEMNKLVKQKTKIEEIKTIYYDHSDIGRYEEPDTKIEDRIMAYKLPQERFPIVMKAGEITKATHDDELNEKVDINPIFIEKLLYKAKEENVLPIVIFFENEDIAITQFRNYNEYVNNRSNSSEWFSVKNQYLKQRETKIGDTDFYNSYTNILEELIMKQIKSANNNTDTIPFSIIKPLYNKFQKETLHNFNINNIPFTIDLFAFLIEFFTDPVFRFESKVHPYYNFGDNGNIPNFLNMDESNDFKELLTAQGINFNTSGGNNLYNLNINGLRNGLSLLTSSSPVGSQLMSTDIVNSIKKNGSSVKSAATFADKIMSTGIDLPYLSSCICQYEVNDMSASQYLQESGRAGRNKGNGIFDRSITFSVNVRNAFTIANAENLSFYSNDFTSNFYTPENITDKFSIIVQNSNSIFDLIKVGQNVNIESFISEELFPGVLQLKQTSERLNYIKRELRELYETCKLVCPDTCRLYIEPLFQLFQKEGYTLVMTSAR